MIILKAIKMVRIITVKNNNHDSDNKIKSDSNNSDNLKSEQLKSKLH